MVVGGLLASCGSIDMLTYDQLLPAEISFPTDIRQIGVVNNMPRRNSPSRSELRIGVLTGEGSAATEELAGSLADSKYFEEVVICDSALQSVDADPEKDPMLSNEMVNSLSRDLGVDMLVSLERLWIETSKKEILYPGWDVPFPVVQATVTPVVRLYLPERSQPLHTISLSDSLFWETGVPLSEQKVLKEATELASSKLAALMAPSWIQTERIYFSGGSVEMRDAAVCLQEGSWQDAQDTWKGLYDRLRKGNNKAKAAYNIALSYEMLGDVEKAHEWICKSLELVSSNSQEEQIVKSYAVELDKRIKEVRSLKIQMSRFNDNF